MSTRRPRPFALFVLVTGLLGTVGVLWQLGQAVPMADPVHRIGSISPGGLGGRVRVTGLPGAPCPGAVGCDGRAPGLLQELARLDEAAERRPRRSTLRALGLAHLLYGNYDDALATFRLPQLADDATRNRADIGATWIARGLARDEPVDVALGLDILLALPDPLPEDLFNRAVALEVLGLRDESAAAWHAFSRLEREPSWRAVSQDRLRKLAGSRGLEAARQSPDAAALEAALLRWSAALLAGDDDAAAASLQAAGELSAGRAAGVFPAGTLEALRSAGRSRRERLARALQAHAVARAAYERREIGPCRRAAREAVALARGAAAPLEVSAHITDASCAFLQGALHDCRRSTELARAALRTSGSPDPSALGQIEWLDGLAAHAGNRPAESLAHFALAIDAYRSVRDSGRVAQIQSLVAGLLDYLGRADDAWSAVVAATSEPALPRERRYLALSALTTRASADGLPNLAREAAGALERAARSLDASYEADAAAMRARVELELGDRPAALRSLRRSLAAAATISQPEVRQRTMAFAAVDLAEALLPDDPAQAAATARSALPVASSGADLFVAIASVEARAAEQDGDRDRAIEILRAAVDRSRAERASLATVQARDEALLRRERAHEELVRLLVDDGRVAQALAVHEDWRGEAFPGWTNGSSWLEPNPAGSSAPGVPEPWISTLALRDELLVWSSGPRGIELRREPVSRAELSALVAAASEEVRTAAATETAAARVVELVFGPGWVPPSRLLLVPDATLSPVPFAALPAPRGQGLLLDRVEIELSPSLRMAQANRESNEAGCALLLRGSKDGGGALPRLAVLPNLDAELDVVKSFYPCAVRATARSEIEAVLASRFRVVHFAGHSVVDAGESGALLLTGPQGVELVAAESMASWRLQGALVVLGSCSAASGRPSVTTGSDGLPRALLAAGARGVVASLWPIATGEALDFAERLHGALASGARPAAAVRAAQRALRAQGVASREWAGWRVVAGGLPAESRPGVRPNRGNH